MIQRRENLPFGAKAMPVNLRVQPGAEQLERDLLRELAVGALGEKDPRHAAAADLVHDSIGTDAASVVRRTT